MVNFCGMERKYSILKPSKEINTLSKFTHHSEITEFNLANFRNSCILICETHPKHLAE